MRISNKLIVGLFFFNMLVLSAYAQNSLYQLNHGYVNGGGPQKKTSSKADKVQAADHKKTSRAEQQPVSGMRPRWSLPTNASVGSGNDREVTSNSADDSQFKATLSSSEYSHFSQGFAQANSQYTLGPDDVINIIVLRHPEVSGEYIINKEGKIQYEFIGDVSLAGTTKEEAIKVLTKRLSIYIVKPQISLKITGYNSKIVYVIGEVARPGRVPMRGDTITVRDALLEAGLPLITAATDNSSVFTPQASGNINIKRVNVTALLYKGDLRENYILHPGDCLYIPATFLAKTMRAISPVTTPIGNVAGTAGAAKYAF